MEFEIRADRRSGGPKPLTREREEYFRLMREGYSHKQACRIVGINPVTGRRWRLGRNASGKTPGAQPVPESHGPAISPRYLSQDERIRIADLLREGASIRAVAVQLGRKPVHDQPGDTAQPGPAWRGVPAACGACAIRVA